MGTRKQLGSEIVLESGIEQEQEQEEERAEAAALRFDCARWLCPD